MSGLHSKPHSRGENYSIFFATLLEGRFGPKDLIKADVRNGELVFEKKAG